MAAKPVDLERIEHMINAIDKIFAYTSDMAYEKFLYNEMVQDAVIKNFEVIGEAAQHVSTELKEKYGHIEWKKIQGLRHILVHDYYKINPEILWNTKDAYLHDLLINLEILMQKEQD